MIIHRSFIDPAQKGFTIWFGALMNALLRRPIGVSPFLNASLSGRRCAGYVICYLLASVLVVDNECFGLPLVPLQAFIIAQAIDRVPIAYARFRQAFPAR
jgi:hypothetical protein